MNKWQKFWFDWRWFWGSIYGTNPSCSKDVYLKIYENPKFIDEVADAIHEMRINDWDINETKSGVIIETSIGCDRTKGPRNLVTRILRKKKLEKLNKLKK